jgi:hypothetical protein
MATKKKATSEEEKAASTPEGTRYRHPWKLRRFEVANTPERSSELEAEGWTLAPLSKAEAGTGLPDAGSPTAVGGVVGATSTTPAGSTTTTSPASPATTTTTPAGSSGSVTVSG